MTMERNQLPTITRLIIGGLLAAATSAFAQGSLTPPAGGPAPTMKSLDQIEPRTAITYDGYYIGTPGSYYVTTNLTGSAYGSPGSPYGIYIASDNVTVDLNGFTLQGVTGSYSGIYIYGSHTNITIRNGIITGWGGDGVSFNYPTATPQNMVVEHLTVTANGHHGIAVGNSCVVSGCSINNNQWLGISVLGDNSRIIHNSLIGNDTGSHPGAAGINVQGNNNFVEDNFVSGINGNNGIVVQTGTSNLVMKNSVIGWGTANDYSIPTFNDGGPVGTAANSTSPWANIAH